MIRSCTKNSAQKIPQTENSCEQRFYFVRCEDKLLDKQYSPQFFAFELQQITITLTGNELDKPYFFLRGLKIDFIILFKK